MPQQYEGIGISVMYPDGWSIEEDTADQGSVSFESPLGAFMTLTRYEGINSGDAIDRAQQVMLAEYDEVEVESIERMIAGRDLSGLALRFVYLDFLIVASCSVSRMPAIHTWFKFKARIETWTNFSQCFKRC